MSGEEKSLKTIFDEAAEITSPEERAAFLERACGDDASLRRHVDALLLAFERAGSFMEVSPAREMLSGTAGGEGGGRDDDTAGLVSDAEGTVAAEPRAAIGSLGSETLLEKVGAAGGGAIFAAPEASSSLQEGPGTVIGPYKLLQRIGEGGMGAVFMAGAGRSRCGRKVALKVIKPGNGHEAGGAARFEAERRGAGDHGPSSYSECA